MSAKSVLRKLNEVNTRDTHIGARRQIREMVTGMIKSHFDVSREKSQHGQTVFELSISDNMQDRFDAFVKDMKEYGYRIMENRGSWVFKYDKKESRRLYPYVWWEVSNGTPKITMSGEV